MPQATRICVYAASSPRIAPEYAGAARTLGALAAARGVELVCGGGATGLMGALADGALEAGGRVTGVLPRFMVDKGWERPGLSRLVVTDTMHKRKAAMSAGTAAAIALPGGVGTLEELLEIITWRKLGLYSGRVVILNTAGYYDPLLQMLQRATDQHFMKEEDPEAPLWSVASTPAEALALALDTPPSLT